MLIAIGVYKVMDNVDITAPPEFKRDEKSAFKSQGFSFWGDATNPLDTFDKEVTKKIDLEVLKKSSCKHFYEDQKHIYVRHLSHENKDHVIVLMTRKELDLVEAKNLFINATHAFIRPQKVNVTFQSILANPYGYTGKDCLPETLKNELAQNIVILQKDLDLLIERGEALENLHDKTIRLDQSAAELAKKAQNLNRCCSYW